MRALGQNHIRVAQVSPGVVETEFSFAMNPGQPEKAEKLYSSMQCIQVGLPVKGFWP
jgi:NADP-dependent 3-hydroxy acid dehydrogenase YdfG